jgi:uncharacterized protein (TIGR03067 family)
MNPHVLIALSVSLSVAADPKDAANKELSEFQGSWVLISAVDNGKALPDKEIKRLRVTIRNNGFQLEQDTRLISEGIFTINPDRKLKEMDEIHTLGRNKGKTYLAIYELDGDRQRLCFADARKPRPTEFSSKPGSGHLLQVWKRERPNPLVRTFTYKKTKEGDLAIHVHFPKDWKKEDKRPAIVFFFGGGWAEAFPKHFEPEAEHLASRGMVAARADYRVKALHGVTPDQCVEDARSVVRWLRQNAGMLGVAPDRIVAAGDSAGGHIAACAGCCPELETAGESPKISSRPNAMILYEPALRFHGEGYAKLLERDDEKLARSITPLLHMKRGLPPTLLIYGKDDGFFPHGEEFIKRSKELGNLARMFTAPGVTHGGIYASPWRQRALQRVGEFLESLGYLEKTPATKLP